MPSPTTARHLDVTGVNSYNNMDFQMANLDNEEELVIGDKVQKVKGYLWPGVIVAIFKTLNGKERYVVECTVPEVRGALHIYSADQIRKKSSAISDTKQERVTDRYIVRRNEINTDDKIWEVLHMWGDPLVSDENTQEVVGRHFTEEKAKDHAVYLNYIMRSAWTIAQWHELAKREDCLDFLTKHDLKLVLTALAKEVK